MKSAPVPFTTLLTDLSDPRSEVRRQSISTIMRRAERGQALPHFLNLLNDPDENVCSSAIHALGSLGDLRALPDLEQQFIGQKKQRLRRNALQAMVRIDIVAALPSLARATQKQNSKIYVIAQAALATLSDVRAVHPLRDILNKKNGNATASTREIMTRTLGQIQDRSAVEALSIPLNDPDLRVRLAAITALGLATDKRAVDLLLSAAYGKTYDDYTKRAIIHVLTQKGDSRAFEYLESIHLDANPSLRGDAILALGRMNDPRVMDLLIQATQEQHPYVRWKTAIALGEQNDPRVVDLLIPFLNDTHEYTLQETLIALGKQGGEKAMEAVASFALHTTMSTLGQQALSIISQQGGSQAFDLLLPFLSHESTRMRSEAVSALLKLDSQRALEPMLSILTEDPYAPIRLEAARFLIRQNDSRAIEPLARAIADDSSLAVRNAAIDFLGRLGDPRAVKPLIAALRGEPFGELRQKAAALLGELGDPCASEALTEALSDANAQVRFQAAVSLRLLKDRQTTASAPEQSSTEVTSLLDEDPISAALRSSLNTMRPEVRLLTMRATHNPGKKSIVHGFFAAELETLRFSVRLHAGKVTEDLKSRAPLVPQQNLPAPYDQISRTALADLEPIRMLGPLVLSLQDSSLSIRCYAITLLGRTHHALAFEPLLSALQQADWRMREAAANALGELGDPRAVEPLLSALRDSYLSVRVQVANALGKLGDPRAVEPLLSALHETYANMRCAVISSLASLGDARALPPLRALLTQGNSETAETSLAEQAIALLEQPEAERGGTRWLRQNTWKSCARAEEPGIRGAAPTRRSDQICEASHSPDLT